MIVVRAPFRVSFLGGGSDLPYFYQQHQGAVLSTAINRHMFLTGRDMYDKSTSLLKYSSTETFSDYNQIRHPIFREVFRMFKLEGVDIGVSSDIPAGSGLGSSSTFTVALVALVNKLQNLGLGEMEIAELACEIEIEKLGEPIGKQDQFASAFGGMNLFTFAKSGSVTVSPFVPTKTQMEWLSSSLFLVEVGGIGRSAGAALIQVQAHVQKNQSATQATKDLADLAIQGFHQIQSSGIETLTALLNEAWRLKKIANPSVLMSAGSAVMELGMSNGAIAGKLLGAGGGGFVLFVVEAPEREKFLESMVGKRLLKIQPDSTGVSVVYEEEDK